MDYPNLLRKFGVCHHKETMFSFVQAMHSDKDTMSPIRAGELYHGRYNASRLAAEVHLGLQSASLAPGQISAQHTHTIAIQNKYIDEVAWIWSLELAADPAFHQTLDLPVQANASWRFLATFKAFLSAVSTGNANCHIPQKTMLTLWAHALWPRYPCPIVLVSLTAV
ncbi:hypothetical protein DSO57_1037262 [Entomophthora muscae]|uniref:Uncharacterized protein n=1 Tax=Entomophthora muscae TaxID=34485 RepID=A0ACC2TL30_9FUNG|nr:hypothetical protein DSO57_1037262 [Entomophthora muscae]